MSVHAEVPETGNHRLKLVKVVAAGILVLGGASGLMMNRTSADGRLKALREDASLQAASVPLPPPVAEPVVASDDSGRKVLFSLRSVQTDVPPDPFQPSAMHQPIPRSPLLGESAALQLEAAPLPQPALPQVSRTPAPVKPAVPETPAVKADEIVLTGVVQGEPPLAVVQFQGQSLFLKIGDQVADSWRLVEIRERSAIFQMGARRVEVPIKGASSE